jgi:hypothetical protein
VNRDAVYLGRNKRYYRGNHNMSIDESDRNTGLGFTRRSALVGATAGLATMSVPVSAHAETAENSSSPSLVFFGARMAVERVPIHMAMLNLYGERASINHGSSFDLIGLKRRAALLANPPTGSGAAFDLTGRTLRADLASNGETQMMRASVYEPGFRVNMTVAEG